MYKTLKVKRFQTRRSKCQDFERQIAELRLEKDYLIRKTKQNFQVKRDATKKKGANTDLKEIVEIMIVTERRNPRSSMKKTTLLGKLSFAYFKQFIYPIDDSFGGK